MMWANLNSAALETEEEMGTAGKCRKMGLQIGDTTHKAAQADGVVGEPFSTVSVDDDGEVDFSCHFDGKTADKLLPGDYNLYLHPDPQVAELKAELAAKEAELKAAWATNHAIERGRQEHMQRMDNAEAELARYRAARHEQEQE